MNPRSRFSSLQPRDRRALHLGSWLLLPSLAMALVIKPYASALLASRAMLQRDRDQFARESRAVLDLPGDLAMLRAKRQALLAIEPRLFGGSDAITASAELARYVGTRATRNGLRLEQTETDTHIDSTARETLATEKSDGHRAEELRVTIRARGGILAVYAFLSAMEAGPRLVRIERVAIVRGSTDDTFDGTVTCTATVVGIALRSGMPGDAAANGYPIVAAGEPAAFSAPLLPLPSDPFRPGRQLPTEIAAAAAKPDTVMPVSLVAIRLLGTVIRPSGSFALCQLPSDVPRMVHIGDHLGELTLIVLEQGRVVFQAPKGARLELSLSQPRS